MIVGDQSHLHHCAMPKQVSISGKRKKAIFMKSSIKILPVLLIFSLELTLSCSTGTPASQPIDHQEIPRQTAKFPPDVSWLPQQVASDRQYLIQDSTAISALAGTPQTRITKTSTVYSIHVKQIGDSLLFGIKQDSVITVSQFPPAFKTPLVFDTAQEFRAFSSFTGQILSLAQDSSPSCLKGIAPAGIRIYELVVDYPKGVLKIGDSWTDTVSTTVCRGKISLEQQILYSYKILRFTTWKQQSAVVINRDATSILNTDSTRKQSGVAGSGKSSALIYADRITGILLQSDAQSNSTMLVKTTREFLPFSQTISTHIELR